MKDYRTKLKYDFAEALQQVISEALTRIYVADDDDRLYLAALAEVQIRLQKKMVVYRPAYVTTFTPVQALSLRMLYQDFGEELANQYTANRMRQIADEIHQHYS